MQNVVTSNTKRTAIELKMRINCLQSSYETKRLCIMPNVPCILYGDICTVYANTLTEGQPANVCLSSLPIKVMEGRKGHTL